MIVRPARLLVAFAVGLGCSAVFTFPSWSSGTVRNSGDRLPMGAPYSKVNNPVEQPGESLPRLVIETKHHTLMVNVPGKQPIVVNAQGAFALKAGEHSVVKKELEPLWQAPPTYFLRRGIQVPPQDSSSRFLRGALGHQALLLDGSIALHSGPSWNDDVGGVRVSPQDMAMLFDVVPVGATVEVR